MKILLTISITLNTNDNNLTQLQNHVFDIFFIPPFAKLVKKISN